MDACFFGDGKYLVFDITGICTVHRRRQWRIWACICKRHPSTNQAASYMSASNLTTCFGHMCHIIWWYDSVTRASETAIWNPGPWFFRSTYIFYGALRCASGCVVECRICNREVAGSNLSLGYFAPRSTQPSIPPRSVNEYRLWLGRQRQVWLIPIADERVGVQVKLWNPLRTRAIHERFCGGDSLRRGAISSICTLPYLWGRRLRADYRPVFLQWVWKVLLLPQDLRTPNGGGALKMQELKM